MTLNYGCIRQVRGFDPRTKWLINIQKQQQGINYICLMCSTVFLWLKQLIFSENWDNAFDHWLSATLSASAHVEHILCIANQRLHFLSLLKHQGLSPEALHLIFTSIVQSVITYMYALPSIAGQLSNVWGWQIQDLCPHPQSPKTRLVSHTPWHWRAYNYCWQTIVWWH